MVGIGVVQALQIPAAVRRELRRSRRRRQRPAPTAPRGGARRPDSGSSSPRSRSARHRRSRGLGERPRASRAPTTCSADSSRERGRRWDGRRRAWREAQAGRSAQAVAQLDRRERVEAELLEGRRASIASAEACPSTASDLGAHQLSRGTRALAPRARRRGDAPAMPTSPTPARRYARPAPRTAPAACRLLPERAARPQIERSRRTPASRPQRSAASKQRKTLLVGERRCPRARTRADIGSPSRRSCRAPCPQSPRQRGAGKAARAAVSRQAVEEGVGGGVVALAGIAERAPPPRRTARRLPEFKALGELVQVPRGVELGAHHALDALASSARSGRRRALRRHGSQHRRDTPRASLRSATSAGDAWRRRTRPRARSPRQSSSCATSRAEPPIGRGAAAAGQHTRCLAPWVSTR